MATIKDIARLSGYSIGTVSRVINKHPDVSDKARSAIEKVIKEAGFQPNSNAKLLKQTVSSAITIFVKGTKNVFLEDILERIQTHLRKSGEEAAVVFLDESENEIKAALQTELERHPRGFIFLGGSLDHFRESFSSLSTPSTLVSADASSIESSLLSSFATDDFQGSREAAKLLIENGHTKIGIIGGYMSYFKDQITSSRLAGTVECMKEYGIEIDLDQQFVPSRFSMDDGYRAAKKLLKKNPDLTAVMTHSDEIAIGALRAFNDMGKRVPEDISLIGFDGIEYIRYTIPRIATIRQDTETMARKAVDDLLMRISYPRNGVHETIPFEVIDKESIRKIENDR
ncbi:MAG: LacI family DNA-binding transcriptional regulator [Solobacterium sp.]|nr:LacI family DNA-binding transcriptional regulator [Solobacterium sp.]